MNNIMGGSKAAGIVVGFVIVWFSAFPGYAASEVQWLFTSRSQRTEMTVNDIRTVSYTSLSTVDMAWKAQLVPNHAVTIRSRHTTETKELYVWHGNGSHTASKDLDINTGLAGIGWEYSLRTALGGPLWRLQWQPGTILSPDGSPVASHTVSLHWLYARLRDPVAIYIGAGTAHEVQRMAHDVPRRPPLWTAQTGVVYALTRDVTVDGRVNMSWRGDERLHGAPLPGTRQQTTELVLGASYAPSLPVILSVSMSQRLDQPGNMQLQFGLRLQNNG